MQSVQTLLPYGCHFLDNTTNHIIGLRNMRGHGKCSRYAANRVQARARPADPSLYQATAPIYSAGSLTGSETRNTVPWGAFAAAERRPPCASRIERLIDKPMPSPSALVV
jgi:hypothetical protein